jgi:hypothetical protein
MSYQEVLIKKVSAVNTDVITTHKSFSISKENSKIDVKSYNPSVIISGVTVDYQNNQLTFDYFACTLYRDNDWIERFAYVIDTLITFLPGLCVINKEIPTIISKVATEYSETTHNIDFQISYSVNYKKFEEVFAQVHTK